MGRSVQESDLGRVEVEGLGSPFCRSWHPASFPRWGWPAAVWGMAVSYPAAPADAAEGARRADWCAPKVPEGSVRQAAYCQKGWPGVPRGWCWEAQAGYRAAEQDPETAGSGGKSRLQPSNQEPEKRSGDMDNWIYFQLLLLCLGDVIMFYLMSKLWNNFSLSLTMEVLS